VSELEEDLGPVLEFPDEPTELQDTLRRALLDGGSWPEGADDELANWLWELWRPALEPEGLDRSQFDRAVVANRGEQWLWIIGDRRWNQFVEGQAGRILRRLPAGPDPATED
jgi:hypothetical protein